MGKGLANEEQTWDVSLTRKTVEVFWEGEKILEIDVFDSNLYCC